MGAGKSKPYRFTPAAVQDLEDIWEFSAQRWSPVQADKYLTRMVSAFERIAANPRMVRERREYTPPVRVYRYESHVIIFMDEADHIAIIRVRHGSEDWASDPDAAGID
jgi:toxin ParE1/3/4